MGTILRKSGWFKQLLLMTAILAGMIGMPQRTSAENVQENVQRQEAETIINQATVTWQNFMQDPDLSGFRTQIKEAKGVLIFPRLLKGAFLFGLEGGNGVLFVRDEKTGTWSEPAYYEISSASFGVQAGV